MNKITERKKNIYARIFNQILNSCLSLFIIFAICISLIFNRSKLLRILLLMGIIFLVLSIFIQYLVKNKVEIENTVYIFAMKQKTPKFFRNLAINMKYRKLFREIMNNGQFHKLSLIKFNYLPLILVYLKSHNKIFKMMTPSGQRLLQNCLNSDFSLKDLQEFHKFYFKSTNVLSTEFITNHHLPHDQMERLINECTIDNRLYLENNLGQNHPILDEIEKMHQIKLNSNQIIL